MAEVKTESAGGIILPGDRATRDMICDVYSIGPDVSHVKTNDKIIIQLGDFKLIKHDCLPDDGDYAFVKEEHIIGVFEN